MFLATYYLCQNHLIKDMTTGSYGLLGLLKLHKKRCVCVTVV